VTGKINIMAKGKIELEISVGDPKVAYISLPEHPGKGVPGVVVKQLRLVDLCADYKGPDIYFDFEKGNHLIGIEIVG
jgi:hypothetical protein